MPQTSEMNMKSPLEHSSTEECENAMKELAALQGCVRDTIHKDEQLPKHDDVERKYGWRAQVHGDPFNLK